MEKKIMDTVQSGSSAWDTPPFGMTIRVHKCYDSVLERVVTSLKQEGFVVLTEIDIKETLKRKLDVDSLPFKMMRVYHPQLTASANAAAPESALLPYSITVAQMEDGSIEIAVTDPLPMLTVAENPGLQPYIDEAYTKLAFLVEWWRKL
jgi:uncharacterized protein (DUF302 family)